MDPFFKNSKDISNYTKFADKCVDLIKSIHPIIIIAMNDIFLSDCYEVLKSSELIKDTISAIIVLFPHPLLDEGMNEVLTHFFHSC